MYAPYRCCCGEPTACCKVWCQCPDEITVSLCKRYTEKTAYACGMGSITPCPIPDGTIIGQFYSAWKINNLKLVKSTNCVVNECPNCCCYVAATGEAQTGTIEAWNEGWRVNCYEQDGDDCIIGNKTCEGYLLGPLSGSSGTWTLNDFSARLYTECCESSSCEGQTIRAVLDIRAGGSRSNATETTDCCTQLTTTGGLTVDAFFKYQWECRHQSRWQGTCPCDLMQEPGTTVIDTLFATGGCTGPGVSAPCPCPTTGQADDYRPDCLGWTVQPVITGCAETTSGIICTTPGNNGSIESISGCP